MCNSLICSILEVHLPHSLHRSATVKAPANRLHAHSLGRYQQAEKKKKKMVNYGLTTQRRECESEKRQEKNE